MPIDPPTNRDRIRLAASLRQRAALVLANGWSDYESVWSSGQVSGTRALLDPDAITAACPEWAPTLWGVTDAETDAATGYERTRKWFVEAAGLDVEELTDTEKSRYRAARSASADLRAAVDSGDTEEKRAAFGQLMQSLSQLAPDETRDKLHVPDDAGEYRDALIAIMRRIPPNWGRWISCDAGWYPIICDLDQRLAELDPNYELHQVKEKLGGLRYYHRSEVPDPDGRMRSLVRAAETRCESTCELCGEPGARHINGRSWLKTLCAICAQAQGYDRIGELVNDLGRGHRGIWKVSCYGDAAESYWDLTHAEVTVGGDTHRDVEVLAPPSVLRTWRIRLPDGTEIESGLIAAIERIR